MSLVNNMMDKCSITVFTPTYNRGYMLGNLYRSLQNQTMLDFEWLIVDDGSTDDTETLVQGWIGNTKEFNIRYIKKENGGKHTAINRGLKEARGKLFFTVDSDDHLTESALEKILSWERSLPGDKKYCGVVGNLGTGPNETPNPSYHEDFLDKNLLERYTYRENERFVLGGERAYVFYTEVHRKYLYPVFDGERFMTEAVTWNRMAADGYIARFFKDILCIYEYQEDGLTLAGKKLFINNPRGYGLWLREKADFSRVSWKNRLKMNYTFICDLSGHHTPEVIADSIGISPVFVKAILLMRKFLGK